MKCPVCKTPQARAMMQVFDDRYGYPGQFTLMKCQSCGHVFLDCDLPANQLTELYTNYYPRRSYDVAARAPHAEQGGFSSWINGLGSSAFRWVPPNVRVLDVGCGFGESLGYHTVRGCDVYGVEADENIRRVADKFGYKVHVGLFDDKVYEPAFFDYVTMDQVIEHVSDPLATLHGVARILKPGGKAVLSTPNANGWGARLFGARWVNWHAPYHLQFFTESSMRSAAEQSGLEVVEVRTVTNSEWLLYQWVHLATCPEPGQPSWFWSPHKEGRRFSQALAVKLIKLIHQSRINHLLARLFDSLALGDNFVFILTKR